MHLIRPAQLVNPDRGGMSVRLYLNPGATIS